MNTNWEKLKEEKVKIISTVDSYNVANDSRLLIPFMPLNNKEGKTNKRGLIDRDGNVILEPIYDIILDDCYSQNDLIRVGVLFPYGYPKKDGEVTSYLRYKYKVVDTKGNLILNQEFDGILVSTDKEIITVHDRGKGYAVYDREGHEIVPFGRYDWIDGFDWGLARVKQGKRTNAIKDTDNKWGIIDTQGNVVLPLEYNDIWNFYGKKRSNTKAEKNGEFETISFFKLLHKSFVSSNDTDSNDDHDYDRYGEYAGSYAQDVMGYSDDLIDDAFEGDPEAYWNID